MPLFSFEHCVIFAKKGGFMLNSHHNRIQSRIIPLGFLPVSLINSSWLHSLGSVLPSRSLKRISLHCMHTCYLEEFLCPALSSHLRKCLSINLPRDVTGILCSSRTGSYPEEECLGGDPGFRLECEKGPQPLDSRHCSRKMLTSLDPLGGSLAFGACAFQGNRGQWTSS